MTNAALMSGVIDAQVQMFVHIQSALQQCDPEIQKVVRDMIAIYASDDATDVEKQAAIYTIRDAIFPSFAEDLGEMERVKRRSTEASEIQSEFERQERTFAERLKSLMEAKGITQEELAAITSVSQPAISHLLNRESRPQQRTIRKFAAALGVASEDLWPT